MWDEDNVRADAGRIAPAVFFTWADTVQTLDAPFEALVVRSAAGDDGWAADQAGSNENQREAACLATAVYFEARGEGTLGQLAVAQVILNRVKAPGFPKTVCGVIYQNAGEYHRCQFSFACDGTADRIGDRAAWGRSLEVARRVLASPDGVVVPDIGNATHYHATYASPVWAGRMKRVDVIGGHVFYASLT
jgi:spore germination cell wall hydrolase CwlJ-like protein